MKSPGRLQNRNRYSLMPNRMNNDNFGYLNGGINGPSINIYKPPKSSLSLSDYSNPRRSSVRLSTYGQSSSISKKKDIRPIKNPKWIAQGKKSLLHFLVITGFPDVSITSLKSPSKKDFQRMFIFLYGLIDPYFEFEESKFEEQAAYLIKALKYPYAETVSKSHIKNVVSPYQWPPLLGMLLWMVEIIMGKDSILQSIDMYSEKSETSGIFQMVSDIYKTFDVFQYEKKIKEVSNELEIKTSEFNTESQRLDQEIEKLEKELEILTTKESPLISAKQANEQLIQQQNYLNMELKDVQLAEQQCIDVVKTLEDDFKLYETQLDELSKEKEKLNNEVIERKISTIEIERSQMERDQLLSQQKSVDIQLDGKRRTMGEFEVELRKMMDDVESSAGEYNNKFSSLGLSNYFMNNEKYRNKLYEIPLPICQPNADDIYSYLNITTLPFLVEARKYFKDQSKEYRGMYIQLQSKNTRMNEMKIELKEENESKQLKIHQIDEKYKVTRQDVKNQLETQNKALTVLEIRVRNVEREGESKLMAWKAKSSKATMEYDELVRLYSDLKEHLEREMLDLIQDVMKIKTTVHDSLLELEQTTMLELNEAKNPKNG
jgi:SMC interacting uncharacterized protein involved in chromosome segregation